MSRRQQLAVLDRLSKNFATQQKLKDDSVVLAMFGAVMDGIGGPAKLTEHLIADFEKSRKDDKPKITLEYHKLFKAYAETYDTAMRANSDLANVSEEDLKATLSELAVSLLMENDEFRTAVLMESTRTDPKRITEMIEVLEAVRDGGPMPAWFSLAEVKSADVVEVEEPQKKKRVATKKAPLPADPEEYDPDAELEAERQTKVEELMSDLERELMEI